MRIGQASDCLLFARMEDAFPLPLEEAPGPRRSPGGAAAGDQRGFGYLRRGRAAAFNLAGGRLTGGRSLRLWRIEPDPWVVGAAQFAAPT